MTKPAKTVLLDDARDVCLASLLAKLLIGYNEPMHPLDSPKGVGFETMDSRG